MEDDDLVDYLHQLQEGIFEAYTGVLQARRLTRLGHPCGPPHLPPPPPCPATPVGSRVAQGLRADGKAEVFAPYIEGCFQLLVLVSRVTEQHGSTDDLLRAAVGVVGDLSSTLGPRFKQHVRQSPYKEAVKLLMKEANKSPSDQTKQVASWANGVTFH